MKITFNNFLELNEWWCSNPKAIRVSPSLEDYKTLEEYNSWNHSITFPCEMEFEIPNN